MMTSEVPRHLLLVTGMHRSGTSALCAAVAAAGGSFGEHLMEAITGVNDEGFWEDSEVVALNDRLLAEGGAHWYSLAAKASARDRSAAAHEEACRILKRGFGDGPLEAVKDPRFCLTLPFWLSACQSAGLPVTVCVANRAPQEVALSLCRRDGFPLGFGLRLYRDYVDSLQRALPDDAHFITFPALTEDPQNAIAPLLSAVGLDAPVGDGARCAVRPELRHHVADADGSLLTVAPAGRVDIPALSAEIESHYAVDPTFNQLAEVVTARAADLTSLGQAHSDALATIEKRDAEIDQLGLEYREAVATIALRDTEVADFDQRLTITGEHLEQALTTVGERDNQIVEFDHRLAKIGEEHSHALQVIAEKDALIDEYKPRIDHLCNLPVLGVAFRMARNRARR